MRCGSNNDSNLIFFIIVPELGLLPAFFLSQDLIPFVFLEVGTASHQEACPCHHHQTLLVQPVATVTVVTGPLCLLATSHDALKKKISVVIIISQYVMSKPKNYIKIKLW